jgi:putative peptidoglycan lipid II flippase
VKRQTVIAGAGIIMVATILSRLLGFVREGTMGYYWATTSDHTNAFWAAFGVPDLLYYLLSGGALSAAVIPIVTGYLHRGEEEESWHVANALMSLFGMFALVGVVLILIFARRLVVFVAPGFGPAQADLCAGYVRIIAPMVLCMVISGLTTGLLQAHRHFTTPAMAWLVYNFGIIGGSLLGGMVLNKRPDDPAGLAGPAYGVVAGALLLVAIQFPALRARGFRFRFSLDRSHPGVQEALRLFLPYMIGLAATQICLLWLPNLFGSYFTGGVASLRYANRLVILPYSLFGISIATAAFPAMAERVAAGQMDEFRKLISGSMRAIMTMVIPCAAGLFVLAGPVQRLLWKRGQFGETSVAMSSFALMAFAGSLIALSGLQVLNRAFFSMKDRLTPPLVAIGYNLVIAAISFLLIRTPLQYAGPAAANTVGAMAGFAVLLFLLRRRLGGVDGRDLALSTARILVASLALAGAALIVCQWTGQLLHLPLMHFPTAAPVATAHLPDVVTPKSRVGLQVLASIAAGLGAYVAVLALLRAPELTTVLNRLQRHRAGAPAVETV